MDGTYSATTQSAPSQQTISPELTWEILSRLASSKSPQPFFSQRNAPDNNATNHHKFFPASPIYDGPAIYSLESIQNEFIHVLQTYSMMGNMSIEEIGRCLGMEERHVEFVGDSLCEERKVMRVENGFALRDTLFKSVVEFINLHCGEHLALNTLVDQGQDISNTFRSGGVSIHYISGEMGLTNQDVMKILDELFNGGSSWGIEPDVVLVTDETTGMPVEVANQNVLDMKQNLLEKQVLAALCGVTPVSLESLLPDLKQSKIPSIVQTLCDDGRIKGILHHSTFTPAVYFTMQRQLVDSFFRANGYLTEKKCIGFGLPKNRMEDFVRETFPDSTILKSSIIDVKQLCLPLEDAVESSILNKTFADLKSLLPEEVAMHDDDLIMLVKEIFVDVLRNRDDGLYDEYCKGVSVVQGGVALFISAPCQMRAKKLVPPLIEDFAKLRASQMAKQQIEKNAAPDVPSIIPLVKVAKCVAQTFPELLDIQQHYEITHDTSSMIEADELLWSPSDNTTSDGPLIEFCRHILDLKTLNDTCQRAIKAETIAIQHKINASSMLEGATRTQNTEEAFESSFRDMCHLLQLFAKGIQQLEGRIQVGDDCSESKIIDNMKTELLMSCGSCLAKRITEYCLFKHAVGEEQKNVLIFDCNVAGLPHREHGFCIPVDFGSLTFPFITLNCEADEDGKLREPLAYLKSLFPPSVGLNLSTMWSYLLSNDLEQTTTQHNLDAFIDHLNETCLSLVGIPFSLVDKKTEKRVLASRRQSITDLLQYTGEKEQVLLSGTVFLYQLAKNMSIAGKSTINLILTNVLPADKKLPQNAVDTLLKLSCDDGAVDDLIESVKKFGTSKNIKSLQSILEY